MITSIPGFKPVDDGAAAPAPTTMVAVQPSDAPVPKIELIPAVAPQALIDAPPDPVVPAEEPGPTDEQISGEASATIAALDPTT